jgi:hypothetical protein
VGDEEATGVATACNGAGAEVGDALGDVLGSGAGVELGVGCAGSFTCLGASDSVTAFVALTLGAVREA